MGKVISKFWKDVARTIVKIVLSLIQKKLEK
jgi:hypothetical protein